MWSPTHVQVTVCRVRGLLAKGKNGTNDAFVTISLGKEKFQTSVKQKSSPDLEWQEECELAIPTQGNTAEIVLTALHQNFIGVDEFLGMVVLPLSSFDVYERPRIRWHTLKSKPGQESKSKNRGEIEVRVAFTVKSGSLLDLSQSKKEKHKGSYGHLSQAAHSIGGSLLSLGTKERKGLKKLASSMGSKLRLPKSSSGSLREDKEDRLSRNSSGRFSGKFSSGEADPGVISEDEDEFRFDDLSHKSSGSSLNMAAAGDSMENLGGGELVRRGSSRSFNRKSQSQLSSLTSSESAGTLQSSPSKLAGAQGEVASSEWTQKLFGKQAKVMPVKEEESSVTADLEIDDVPSIIIRDPFILAEEDSAPAEKAKKKNKKTKTDEVQSPPPVVAAAAAAVETKAETAKKETAAEAEAGEEEVAHSKRMSKESFLPSLPVDDQTSDDFLDTRPPVPLPSSRSPQSNEMNAPEKPKRNTSASARLVHKELPNMNPFSHDASLDYHDDTMDTAPEEALNVNLVHQRPPPVPKPSYDDEDEDDEDDDDGDDDEELNDSVATVDLFNDRTVEISPVERATVLTEGYGTPLTNNLRRDRLLSLFSTPNSEKNEKNNEEDHQPGPIQLDWMEPASNCSSSQGFVGSGHLSSASTTDSGILPASRLTDSANEESHDQFDTTTPPVATPGSRFSARSSSSKADLSWDSYDIRPIATPESGEVKEEVLESTRKEDYTPEKNEPTTQRKRISLAACLKKLSLDYPTAESPDSLGSPVKEQADVNSGSQPDLWQITHGESHRKKMAASFHQRVVVGEEKPGGKSFHNRDINSSVTLNGQHPLLYQGRSREALITLLEDRDNEIADLKDYLESLLVRVMDNCPTVLQTPCKKPLRK